MDGSWMSNEWMFMRSKNDLKNELAAMKQQLSEMKAKENQLEHVLTEKSNSEKMGTNLLELYKFMMTESKATRQLLLGLSDKLTRMEEEINSDFTEEVAQDDLPQIDGMVKEVPISSTDKTILQHIQSKEMACADDIKKLMNYRGRNGATARLTRLCKLGLIRRYQLGHRVYYKFALGKMTSSTLIVSPPQ